MSSEGLNVDPNGEPLVNRSEISDSNFSVVIPDDSASKALIDAIMVDSSVSDELVTQESDLILTGNEVLLKSVQTINGVAEETGGIESEILDTYEVEFSEHNDREDSVTKLLLNPEVQVAGLTNLVMEPVNTDDSPNFVQDVGNEVSVEMINGVTEKIGGIESLPDAEFLNTYEVQLSEQNQGEDAVVKALSNPEVQVAEVTNVGIVPVNTDGSSNFEVQNVVKEVSAETITGVTEEIRGVECLLNMQNLDMYEVERNGGDDTVVKSLSNPEVQVAEGTNVGIEPFNTDGSPNSEVQNAGKLVSESGVSSVKENQAMEVETNGDGMFEQSANSSTRITYDVSTMGSLVVDLFSSFGKTGIDDGGCSIGGKMTKTTKEKIARNEQLLEGEFAFFDLVWGKVKSHPWWPAQVLDPSLASEEAMKFKKKGGLLVAYFGDQTFAWNELSSLKPFKAHFSRMEKQTTMTSFQHAVSCALDEVSRRVELGLCCSCTPEQAYTIMKSQKIMTAGIQGSAYETEGLDSSFSVASFEPDKLVKFVKNVAMYQCDGGDRLKLAMAKAQVASFYRSKGFLRLPAFHVSEWSTGNNNSEMPAYENQEKAHVGEGKLKSPNGSFLKLSDNLEGSLISAKKGKSLTELLGRKNASSSVEVGEEEKGASRAGTTSSRKNHKASESTSGDTMPKSAKRRQLSSKAFVIETPTSRDPKVGQRLSSIAAKLADSPPVFKLSDVVAITDTPGRTLDGRVHMPSEDSSPNEMLSQLCLAAQDPRKGYSFLNTIIGFFTGFRDSLHDSSSSLEHKKHEKHKSKDESNPSNSKVSSTDSYGYGDVSNSYLTDRTVQSSSDEQLSNKAQKRKKESLLVTPLKNNFSPTALILNFKDANSIPLESDLNQIFSNFGSLKESETEILRKTKRAKVVFERRDDAEAAFSRAGKYEVFGPALVSYKVTPSKPSRTKRPRRESATSLEGNSI